MIVALTMLIAGLCLLLYLIFAYSFLVPAPRGLYILMYHKVSEDRADSLTVKRAMLERQFGYLVKKHYTTVSFATVLDSMRTGAALPPRPVIITFDDGYRDAYTIVFPLLKQYGLKATVFPVAGRIAQTNTWDATHEQLMDAREIREMADSGVVEFGLHSYDHANYQRMTPQQIGEDLERSRRALDELGIPFAPVLSFPYGAFPREARANAAMRKVLADNGIRLAVRIGGRVNRLPISDPYELKRAGITGRDRFFEFRIKLRKGRTKLF
jgi:peptidoglycan/xylan/chitin deacetylase (PgdA/CDA1 family)